MVRKTTKNNKDFIFKVILSALLTASVTINGIMAYNVSKIAKNTQTPSQINEKPVSTTIDVNPVLNSNEILTTTITPETNTEETVVNTEKADENTNETIDVPYVIKSGDKLSEIINNNYGKYDYKLLMAFAKYNNIKNIDKIYTGDFLYIPTEEKLNEIIAQNNGFVVKTQTKPSVVAKTNVAKSNNVVSTENKVISNETKNDIILLNKNVEENTNSISTLDTKVNENIETLNTKTDKNTEAVSTLDAKVNKNTENISSLDTKITENTESISSLEQTVERQENNIDVMDKKLNSHSRFEASEINTIDKRLSTLEQSWIDGLISIDEALQRMNDIEQAIQNLSNNTISKEEAMSIIDNSDVKSELIPQNEAIFPEEDEILTKQEKITDFDLPFVEENDMNISSRIKLELIPQDEAILPSDEIQTPKAERISEDEAILPSDEIPAPKTELIPEEELNLPSDNIIFSKEEKINDVELPYIETENEEVKQSEDDEEKMILPSNEYQEPKEEFIPEENTIFTPVEQKFVRNIPESIIAYTKTR